MELSLNPISYNSFTTFGDLLEYLRRRERLTQLELSIAVGYSESQITRLEKNQRLPDLTALKALFIPALHLEDEPQLTERFLELAQAARQEDAPAPGIAPILAGDCPVRPGKPSLWQPALGDRLGDRIFPDRLDLAAHGKRPQGDGGG